MPEGATLIEYLHIFWFTAVALLRAHRGAKWVYGISEALEAVMDLV
jgi:hypothetical protein